MMQVAGYKMHDRKLQTAKSSLLTLCSLLQAVIAGIVGR
jgi:hypothetical protein